MTAALLAEGVTVRFGARAVLDHLDLTVETGAWLTIVGPNGGGKTTLLRALAGLVRAEGTLAIAGQPLRELHRRDVARAVALVPQAPVLPAGMTVVDYVLLGRTPHLRPLGVEGPTDLAAVHETLALLDLVGLADRVVATLSGGERQRVVIARALAQASPILLLDEPTAALDVGHQQEVLELVDRLRHERQLTVLSTMHDLTLAGQYADRLALLDRGRIVADGPAAQVLTEEHVARYYHAKVRVVQGDDGVIVVPLR